MKSAVLVALLMCLCSCEKKPDYSNITVAELLHERDNLITFYNDTINSLNDELKACSDSRAADTSKELKVVYEGYVHPSGNYKWTSKGWLALKLFLRMSDDSTKIIPIK